MAATPGMSSQMQTSTQREAEMKKTYVFDVDGTLTAPRQPIESVFAKFFLAFAQHRSVVLVSGSDLSKLQEQLPDEILNACQAVFPCSGGERWERGKRVYRKTHQFPTKLLELCENFVAQSSYPERFGNHIEYRTGMLNVSTVGRNASVTQRDDYFAWDKSFEERARFVTKINAAALPYEASSGGQISIDIAPRGWNKSVVFNELLADDMAQALMFFGDRIEQGGNDRPLAEAIWLAGAPHEVRPVETWSETFEQLLLEAGTRQLAA
jgi:phosphomannomutase